MKKARKSKNASDTPKKNGNTSPNNNTIKRIASIGVGIIACWIGFYLSYFMTGNSNLVTTDYTLRRSFNISCTDDYKDQKTFKKCTPVKVCGRVVQDNIVSEDEAERLLKIAKRGFRHGGSSGGASILDLHSGALSHGEKFVNIFKYLDDDVMTETFSQTDFEFYSVIKARVHETIANEFGIEKSTLYLTHPTFFSRITNVSAKTQNDEYWHKHIDKLQYGSFDYTSLLYLTNYNQDFTGGRFIFDDDKTMVVEPRKGRLSYFTSGSENPHHVEKVESGTRYAITISFTCDPSKSIKDPSLKKG